MLLCQGFLTGLSCGMIFGPIPTIISHWFKKRRSTAFGISAVGSAVGGTVIPIASSHLIDRIGYVRALRVSGKWPMNLPRFKWTMRVIALVTFCMLAIANLVMQFGCIQSVLTYEFHPQTLRRRLAPPKDPGPFFAWHEFRKPAFNVFVLAGSITFLGLYTRTFHPFVLVLSN